MVIADPRVAQAETVIFDLDDTLIPTIHAQATYLATLTRELAVSTGEDENTLAQGFRAIFQGWGVFDIAEAMDQHAMLWAHAGDRRPSEAFAEARHAAEKSFADLVKPDPTLIDGLNRLKAAGKRLVVYTEGHAAGTAYKMQAAGLNGCFAAVFAPRAAGLPEATRNGPPRYHGVPDFPKDDIGGLKSVLAQLYPDDAFEAARQKVVVVGDNIARDVKTAADAGVPVVHTREFRQRFIEQAHDALTIAWATGPGLGVFRATAQTLWGRMTYRAPNIVRDIAEFADHVLKDMHNLARKMAGPAAGNPEMTRDRPRRPAQRSPLSP